MIGFFALAVLLIVSAIWTISASKPVYSVVALLMHFAALAAMYVTLNAEFLAVTQIIVYSGAILVLFLFVIALLSSGVAPFAQGPDRLPKAVLPAGIGLLVGFGLLVFGVSNATPLVTAVTNSGSLVGPTGRANVFGSVADFGKALFTTHLLPFEITALILMVAVIGVVMLAGDTAPYVPRVDQMKRARRDMREAILREGGE